MPALARHKPAHALPRVSPRAGVHVSVHAQVRSRAPGQAWPRPTGCKTASKKISSFSRSRTHVRYLQAQTAPREFALFPVASVSGKTDGEIRNGSLSHRLLTGLSLDETIARIAINSATGTPDAQNSRTYLTDALNSVIAQLNADDNTLANSYGYSPYGESQTIGPDGTNNPIQYTSRENDGTGLMFYRARYYDPVLKRFISEDPIGLEAGSDNFAMYVEGNPVSYTDALGLASDGHHWVIGPIRHDPNLSPDATKVFRDAKTGPYGEPHRWSKEHNQYNKGVQDLWKSKNFDPPNMTKTQAQDFVKDVMRSRDPRIADYRRVIINQCLRYGMRRGSWTRGGNE